MMTVASARTVATLLARAPLARLVLIVPALIACVVMIGASAYLAVTPTGAEEANAYLGRADWRLQSIAALGLGEPAPREIADAARASGARRTYVHISSPDLTGIDLAGATYDEGETGSPLWQRYSLVAGRWPAQTGEVVVTQEIADRTDDQATLEVFGGVTSWQIVGTVRDNFDFERQVVLAAPGTWAAVPADGHLPSTEGFVGMVGSGGDVEEIARAVARLPTVEVDAGDLVEGAATRDTFLRNDPQRALTEPSIVWTVPMVIGLIAAVVVPGLVFGGWVTAISFTLWRVGLPQGRLQLGAWLLIGVGQIAAVAVGMALGVLIGLAARPVWLILRQGKLGDPVIPWALIGVVLALVTAGVALLIGQDVSRRWLTRERLDRWSQRLLILMGAAGIAVLFANVSTARERTSSATWVLVGVVVLTTTVVALAARAMLPSTTRTSIVTFACRRLRRTSGLALLLAVLTLITGSGLGFVVLVHTSIRNNAADIVADLPPGAAQLGSGQREPSADLRMKFEQLVGVTDPVRVATMTAETMPQGTIWVMSRADVERLAGHPLTRAQHIALDGDGLLTPKNLPSIRIVERRLRLDATHIDLPREFANRINGIIGIETARRHGLTGVQSYLYLGLSQAQVELVRDLRASGRFDSDLIRAHRPVPPPETPPIIYAIGLGFSMVSFMIVLTAYGLAVGAHLRPEAAGLAAIGVPRRWIHRVLALQCAWVAGVSLVAGSAAGLAGVGAIVLVNIDNSRLFIPWPAFVIALGAAAVAVLAASAVGMRKINHTERLATF